MLSADMMDSAFFRRLTGRLKPKLVHPTAKAFDIRAWPEVTATDVITARDETLARAADLVGFQMRVLREKYLAPIFEGLARSQIIDLAIADANRAWTIIRWKFREAMAKDAGSGGAAYLSVLGEIGIPVGPDGALVSPDDANNAAVDSLPHWFAAAADAPEAGDGKERALDVIAVRAQMAFNLEHVYRDIWQEVLWEPWTFSEDEAAVTLTPDLPEEMSRWKSWDWREQALAMQMPVLARNLERGLADIPLTIGQTAVALDAAGAIVVGPPGGEQARSHRSAIEVLERSYLAIFLDEPLAGVEGMTPHVLESAICVLQDLAELHLPAETGPATYEAVDLDRLRCAVGRPDLVALLGNTIGLPADLADACLTFLSADPFGELGSLFTTGLWHRPLVRADGGETLLMVAGALVWGSPLRRLERWLQAAGTSDLSGSRIGLQFEARYRERLDAALRRNAMLRPVSSGVTSVPAGQAEEEIDLLFRIGSTVVVGEVKCLLAPSEAIERFDYLRKLEEACAQAARKARWLELNPGEAERRVGAGPGENRFVPLVVVNQSNGVEWSFDGCVVTDTRFLRLFLSGGEYSCGAALFTEEGKQPVLFQRTLYDSADKAEAAIPAIFEKHPGMDPFRDALKWVEMTVPLCDGRSLRMAHPAMDTAAYQAGLPDVSDL